MRPLLLIFLAAGLAIAESHPSWWGLASPDATALVGIRWDVLKGSVFADPVESELHGSLAFPELAILKGAKQIVISSPGTLAMLTGSFPAAAVRSEATARGLKATNYKGVDLWISPGKTLSIAQMNEQLILIGARKSLEAAINRDIDHDQAEGASSRHYSPLLARAARYAQADLWVVTTRLPDPLASLFVPLDVEARGFEGWVSVSDGIELGAALEAGSEDGAAVMAENLRQTIPSLPEVARNLRIVAEAEQVQLTLQVTRSDLSAALRTPEQPTPGAKPDPAPIAVPATPVAAPVLPSTAPAGAPAGPQVIRIFGLDEGTREIPLTPIKPNQP